MAPGFGYLTVKEKKRGTTSIFQFSISALENNNCKEERKSIEFEIANLAKVSLKLEQNSKSYDISLAYRKHQMAKNSIVNMIVSFEDQKFFKKICCPENCSELRLGELSADRYRSAAICYISNKYHYSTFAMGAISVNVYKEPILSNPLLYEDQEFTDYELIAADGSLAVHKVCLAARSDVFRRMFAGEWKETVEGSVEVKDVAKQTLQDIKDFIYMGQLTDDGLRTLITVAKRYMITDLVEACAKKIAETVLPEDLYSLHEFACLNNLPELSCAITELTPDRVVHEAYEIKMAKRNAALKNDTK